GVTIHNRSIFFEMLNRPIETIHEVQGLTPAGIERMRRRIERLREKSPRVDFGDNLVRDEFALTLDVLSHGCARADLSFGKRSRGRVASLPDMKRDLKSIMERHERLWLARNRRGGLKASISHYKRNLREYA
ncbi:MAG: hypothetical protein KDA33_06100, partial [Phycisphaerales bacterium]|nr:hypothetical protein [Phycisphaerales bacterium]